jgi:hypothetical protein
MADWSLDNQISNRLFKVDNDLAPFYRSVSCWSLIGVWMMDLYAGFRQYSHWQIAGQLFLLWLLLATATAILGVFLYRRGRLVNYLKMNHPAEVPVPQEPYKLGFRHGSDSAIPALRSLSAGMVQLAGTLLMVVFCVIHVWR